MHHAPFRDGLMMAAHSSMNQRRVYGIMPNLPILTAIYEAIRGDYDYLQIRYPSPQRHVTRQKIVSI